MSFKLGLVGLCTSHPENWVPAIRTLKTEGKVDAEVVAVWDSGETRPADFARDFAAKFSIPRSVERLEEMLELVDGVIVHTTNWDRHLEQARPFVDAGKAVLLDKPIAGNLKDIAAFLDWIKQGKRVCGGSSLRFCAEVGDYLRSPVEERGEPHLAFSSIGVDDFNYGIHGYAMLSCLFGPGLKSVQYLGSTRQKQFRLVWTDGRAALLNAGQSAWLPFNLTVTTTKQVKQLEADCGKIYYNFLAAVLPYLTGAVEDPPLKAEEWVEPELAALAARMSWMNHGQEIFLGDLRLDDPGFDGTAFAREYRRARMG